jgi:hypothetical protein
LGAVALLLVIIGGVLMITNRFTPGLVMLIFAVFFGLCALSYLYTTLHGKFVWWADLLDDARLKGDEYAVDLGCGRGAVMISLAKRLTTGRVSGIDLWCAALRRRAIRSCGLQSCHPQPQSSRRSAAGHHRGRSRTRAWRQDHHH